MIIDQIHLVTFNEATTSQCSVAECRRGEGKEEAGQAWSTSRAEGSAAGSAGNRPLCSRHTACCGAIACPNSAWKRATLKFCESLKATLKCSEKQALSLVELSLELIHAKVHGAYRRTNVELSYLIAMATGAVADVSSN